MLEDQHDNDRDLLSNLVGQLTNPLYALPSFSASFETSLVQPFTQLGVTEAFDTRRANFSEITDKEGLAVTNIFHKALIEVDTHYEWR